MNQKESPNKRNKRQAKVLEDSHWDCSVCTYRNTAEAFKCLMCDVRKGTSTRKPRINPQLAAQQVSQQQYPSQPKTNKKEGAGKDKMDKKNHSMVSKSGKRRKHPPRLKNIDRSTAKVQEITVNNVTVVITEYQPKVKKTVSETSGQSVDSSASSESGSQSESSTDARVEIGTESRSS
uniref:RanBP2-type domain-containing protein n=1 Tax=Timema genevievae TaxID=629358 RepID=A0A7R9JZY5_TIMGE|nr:unnamed protein product [Timema genevievae]